MRRFLVLCLAVSSALAQTSYVATNGSNTTGDGSSGNPWGTIEFALTQVPDASTILVKAGRYDGRVRLQGQFVNGVIVQSEQPYRAQLRHTSTVITCFDGQGITLQGFDIAHAGTGAGALVIQIQDLIGDPGGADAVSRIQIRDNIIHDSFNNDLLKINNGARQILVEGNVFYNQNGSDEHIDINGVVDIEVRDNIFFNDFAGSGRPNNNDTSSFIVVKNSGGLPLNQQFLIHRNIFMNWQGSSGSNFLLFGEDGQSFFEAQDALVQNNLFVGNAQNNMRAAFGVKGCRDITYRNNTIVGDLPALAFAMRLNREGANLANELIAMRNNIWSDPSGTMGATSGQNNNDFSDTPASDTASFTLAGNLYWNGGQPVPQDAGELINYTDDATRILSDPQLPDPSNHLLPRWDPGTNAFISGNTMIRDEFERLVNAYAVLGATSAALDGSDPAESPVDDILGRTRGPSPDLGAWERSPCALVADLDGDSDVDIDDLQLLWADWRHAQSPPFDLDGDNLITLLDLSTLINGYASCP